MERTGSTVGSARAPRRRVLFPLAGDVDTRGKTVDALRTELTDRLKRFIPDPVVTVAVRQIVGNRIFVIGQVNRPGDFQFSRPVDVMQALSMAGGTTSFAALNDIVILRRERGTLQTLKFHYADVARGQGSGPEHPAHERRHDRRPLNAIDAVT